MPKKQAFTLVELIVVITILAILSTIAFLSFQGYSSSARDSSRLSDLSNLAMALETTAGKWGTLPQPASPITLTAGATTIGYQWYADKAVLSMIGMSDSKDPLDSVYYTYSTNAPQTKYQVLGYLESADSLAYSPVGQVYAEPATYSGRIVVTKWAQLGILMESTTSLPIQAKLAANSSIDVASGTTSSWYTAQFSNNDKLVATWGTVPIITTMTMYQPKNLSSLDSSLMGYWDMETTNGTKLKDLSGYGNDGISNGWVVIWWVNGNGRTGKAEYFNWSGTYMAMGNQPTWILSAGTLTLWYTNNTTTTAIRVLIDRAGTSANGLILTSSIAANSGTIDFQYGTGVGFGHVTYIQNDLNVWHFLVVTWNALWWKLYVDGVLRGTNNVAIPSIVGLPNTYIGSHMWTLRYHDGNIDEVRIYNRSLSDSEITTLYNSTK